MWGCSVHYRAVNSIPGLHSLHPRSIPPSSYVYRHCHLYLRDHHQIIVLRYWIRHLGRIISSSSSQTDFLSRTSGDAFDICGRQLGESTQHSAVSAVRTVLGAFFCVVHGDFCQHSPETCFLVLAVLPALCFWREGLFLLEALLNLLLIMMTVIITVATIY